jgi:hypothetical protein
MAWLSCLALVSHAAMSGSILIYGISGLERGTGGDFCPSLLSLPPLIIPPSLLHEVCDTPE